MLISVFVLPLVTAFISLALSRTLPTRGLALGAAAALAVAAALLLFARSRGETMLPEFTWQSIDDQVIDLSLSFDRVSAPLGVVTLGGGALGFVGLALALPRALRGFGGLVAAALLGLVATLLGLAMQNPLLLPMAWAVASLMAFAAHRSSGAAGTERVPGTLLAGLAGALLMLAGALALGGDPAWSLLPWTGAVLLAIGGVPFHAALDEQTDAPASLATILLAIGLPLLGGGAILRLGPLLATAPGAARSALIALGLLVALACGAGALGERRLRRLIAWQLSAQLGLLLVSAGIGNLADGVGIPLLASAALTTLAGGQAVSVLERHAGTDDITLMSPRGPLPLLGLGWVLAGAGAIGLPGTWGFWARQQLYESLAGMAPWAVAPAVIALVLLGFSYLAPTVVFWRAEVARRSGSATSEIAEGGLARVLPALSALPLVILGVVPQIGPQPGPQPELGLQIGGAAAALTLIGLALVPRRLAARRAAADPDAALGSALPPQALGESLAGLARLANPAGLLRSLDEGITALSNGVRRALSLFEQRYYIAGLLIGIVVVILLIF